MNDIYFYSGVLLSLFKPGYYASVTLITSVCGNSVLFFAKFHDCSEISFNLTVNFIYRFHGDTLAKHIF